MAKCKELTVICHQCKYLFRRDERYENCPHCGESRACGQYAVKGSVLCVKHGGQSVERQFRGKRTGRPMTTGKNSKSLISRMSSKYSEMTKDAMYVLNKKSIDLLDARIIDLLDRTDAESSPERVARITEFWKKLNEAVPGLKFDVVNDTEGYKAYLALDAEVEAAYHDYMAWKQIFEALELRRKHTESEMRILKDMKALMTAEDGMELVSQLFAAILKVLRDEPKGPDYIHLIRLEFDRITGATTVGKDEAGNGEIVDL